MIVEASVSGIFKTVLMVLGTFVLLRFFGQMMVAKRNLDAEKELKAEKAKFEKELKRKKETFGKTSILSGTSKSSKIKKSSSSIEDVDFEEIE
jgi:hypothetical protein